MNCSEYQRMIDALCFYRHKRPDGTLGLSHALQTVESSRSWRVGSGRGIPRVRVVAYCIMPTHIHLFLEQKTKNGISEFMRLILNSYARYFNLKIGREGPLWASRFKCVPVETDEQALHLSRYIHLNPCSAGLVSGPEAWKYSSYEEYIGGASDDCLCDFKQVVDLQGTRYQRFVEDRVDYQRSLQAIKAQLLD